MGNAMGVNGVSGDSWKIMALVDRMVELEELIEVKGVTDAGQDRLFVKGRRT